MPLEEKKDIPKKEEGGEKLDQEAIRNIAVAVKGLIDQDKEKGQLSQEIAELRKGIKSTNEGLTGLRQLFCTEDGKICFPTLAQLDAYVQEQGKKMENFDGKLDRVIEVVGKTKQPSLTGPEELKPLEDMTAGKRRDMTEEGNRARDKQVDRIEDYFKVSDNDRWRKLRRTEANLDVISGKPEMVSRVLKAIPSMPQDQKGKITQVVCTDKECRVQLEKEQGARIYKQDGKGRWKWLDEPEKEGPHI